MKAVITRDGAVRLNVPEGTVVEFNEQDVSRFGNVVKVMVGNVTLFNFSLSPFTNDTEPAAELIDD